jgi:hypothetical protein
VTHAVLRAGWRRRLAPLPGPRPGCRGAGGLLARHGSPGCYSRISPTRATAEPTRRPRHPHAEGGCVGQQVLVVGGVVAGTELRGQACAVRRDVASPAQPGGTWRTVPGSTAHLTGKPAGDNSMPLTRRVPEDAVGGGAARPASSGQGWSACSPISSGGTPLPTVARLGPRPRAAPVGARDRCNLQFVGDGQCGHARGCVGDLRDARTGNIDGPRDRLPAARPRATEPPE